LYAFIILAKGNKPWISSSRINMTDNDFYNKALASLTNQIVASTANSSSSSDDDDYNPTEYAKSLIEQDLPKIESAIKSYTSLVAARSSTVSDIDLLSCNASSYGTVERKCVFLENGNISALTCARTLLRGINSTSIPHDNSLTTQKNPREENHDSTEKERKNVVCILWNGLVNSQQVGDKKKMLNTNKPSKLLGKDALVIAYPFISERFRRGVAAASSSALEEGTKESRPNHETEHLQSLSDEELPPIDPPKNVDIVQWKAFYTEFGNLLSRACCSSKLDEEELFVEDDSKLLWSMDGGLQELEERRERRSKRAKEALCHEKISVAEESSETE
jgi:hypothetical protein